MSRIHEIKQSTTAFTQFVTHGTVNWVKSLRMTVVSIWNCVAEYEIYTIRAIFVSSMQVKLSKVKYVCVCVRLRSRPNRMYRIRWINIILIDVAYTRNWNFSSKNKKQNKKINAVSFVSHQLHTSRICHQVIIAHNTVIRIHSPDTLFFIVSNKTRK